MKIPPLEDKHMTTITYASESATHPRQINIITTRIERHFCKCSACKQASTIDFFVTVYEFSFFSPMFNSIVWEPRAAYYTIDAQGNPNEEVKNTSIAACPRCGALKPKNSELKASKVKYDPTHACTDSCQKATSDNCTCSCKGEGHGILNKVGLF